MKHIYFDHNSTTSLHPKVQDAMRVYGERPAGNPSSLHWFGQESRRILDQSRRQVADFLGATPEEIIFTSGGTEANNLVLQGLTRAENSNARRHIITSAIEHQAVLHPCAHLQKLGWRITYVKPQANGAIDPEEMIAAITDETALISLMLANNETGVVQPVAQVAAAARKRDVLVHTDAVQAAGKIPLRVDELGVDFLTISAHKFYGPSGAGILYHRRGKKLEPLMLGGHHEHHLRPGSENMLGVVGLAAACQSAAAELAQEQKRQQALRLKFEAKLGEQLPLARIQGALASRLSNTTYVTFPGVDGDLLAMNLDLLGIAVSTGAACSSSSHEPSHVLLAMGLSEQEARSAIRFSLGRENTEDDIDVALKQLIGIVSSMRVK